MAARFVDFDWDPLKAASNATKHGIRFERAAKVFSDPNALTIFDSEHSGAEDRWITLGLDESLMLLVVCHTHRMAHGRAFVRIISARKATKSEAKWYNEVV